jgi:hypothetical protein
MTCWWRRRESNLPAPFGFCNLLILQKEESAKRPTQACLSYNYRTILLVEKRATTQKNIELREEIENTAVGYFHNLE